MNNTSNIKDTLSTIFGILFAIAGALLTASQSGLVLPTWAVAACGSVMAISGAIIGYLTGKTPAAQKKTEEIVVSQNVPKP